MKNDQSGSTKTSNGPNGIRLKRLKAFVAFREDVSRLPYKIAASMPAEIRDSVFAEADKFCRASLDASWKHFENEESAR